MNIVKLKEEKARVWEQMKALLDEAESEGRDFTAEEEESWERMEGEIQKLDREIERLERAQRIASSLDVPDSDRGEDATDGGFVAEWRDFLAGERRGIDFHFTARDVADLDAGKGEARDVLKSASATDLVPTDFVRRLREHLIENSAIRQTNVTVLVTATGEDLRVPKTTAHPTAALVAEAAAIGENDPTFSSVVLQAYKYANLTQVSSEMETDEAVNLLEYLARANGVALGNASGADFITGDGTNKPRGVQTAATVGKTGASGQTTSVTADDLIDLYHSVVSGYRRGGFWLMRDGTLAAVRKLKDADNQYLWQPGLQAGQPDVLLGRPVVTDPNMPAMAASAKSILFGDFSGYYIRDVGTIRFERSDDFAFNTDLITFRAILRTDGDLVDENAVKAYQNSAT